MRRCRGGADLHRAARRGRSCASGSRAGGPILPRTIEQRLRTAEIELGARSEFPHVVVNDEVQKAASELEKLVRE